MRSLILISFACLSWTLAASHPDPIHVPILRRSKISDRVAGLPKAINAIKHKYGLTTNDAKRTRRTTVSSIPITDEQGDTTYSGVVSIGTPAQNFNVMLDTGSADLWMATTPCTTCASDVHLFDPSKSSTYENVSMMNYIFYASGAVDGYVSKDTVTFGGLTVQYQSFLAVDDMSMVGSLDNNLSGIMGLGFMNISEIQSLPFWQGLYNQNLLPQPVFGFYLERHADQLQIGDTVPGGTFTLGGTNTSLYTGEIEFINMPNGTTPSYWLQQVQTVTVQGISINVPSDNGLAAIDTGTTLLGVPESIFQEIWAKVPGAVALTGTFDGMYGFPCSTEINMTISFGGTSWAINATDMNYGPLDTRSGICVGATFPLPDLYTGSEYAPTWIIGDVFLKNVYSVFRADPPAVGFAHLSTKVTGPGGLNASGSARVGGCSSASLTIAAFLVACFSIVL